MSITKYVTCPGKNARGNRSTVFLVPAADLDAITLTSDEVSAVTMESGKTFSPVRADLDTVQFTTEGTGKAGYAETQSLVMMFSKKSKALVALKNQLVAGVACGLIAIRVDANGKAWLSGYGVVDGKSRPYNEIEANFDSGTLPTDDPGNAYTITLRRLSAEDEIPFDDTSNATIVGGTAAFIGW